MRRRLQSRAAGDLIPRCLVAGLLTAWLVAGTWICLAAPLGSGTDESLRYVAFAAAKNRPATAEDYRRYDVDHFYYPPLYFLLFAPFFGDEPAFTVAYPPRALLQGTSVASGGLNVVSPEAARAAPGELRTLYRSAKFLSLLCGLGVLLALVGTLRTIFPGRGRWWLVLAGTAPCVLLPQFLYYQTLCNNDALLNALAALALFCAARAVLAPRDRGDRRFLACACASAAAIGLGFLTKFSAVVLLPLLPGLAWAFFLRRRETASRFPLREAGALLAGMTAVVIAAGGWWVAASRISLGDWTGLAAQRMAHPWAVLDPPGSLLNPWWLLHVGVFVLRSYFALFSGPLIGIPDRVFLWYLLGLLALVAGLAAATVVRAAKRRPAPRSRKRRRPRSLLALLFAAVFLWNVATVLIYNVSMFAPYGRLLFPSLVASHSLLAWAVLRAAGARRRGIAGISLVLTLVCGALFGWVFSHRLVEAVEQPEERLVPLAYPPEGRLHAPIWDVTVEQAVSLPPGRLRALRVPVLRTFKVPQAGSVLSVDLAVAGGHGGRAGTVAAARAALGDGDATERWVELDFPKPVDLAGATAAVVRLRASRPWIFPSLAEAQYGCSGLLGRPGESPARINGTVSDVSLGISALYDPGGR